MSEEARTYVVGLPVVITVHSDGTVEYEVDTAEASHEVSRYDDDEFTDEQISADAEAVDFDYDLRLLRKGWLQCANLTCGAVVTCSERAFRAGIRICHEHWQEAERENITAGPICIDDFFVVMGQYWPNLRWNGWLMPRIDAWSVAKVIEGMVADGDEYHRFEWREDGALVHTSLDGEDEYPEVLEPDEDGLYALGAGSWVWQEAWPEIYHLADPALGLTIPDTEEDA